MTKLPVFGTIGATFAFVRSHFADCIRITWLPIAITSVGSYWITRKTQVLEARQHGLNGKAESVESLQLGLQALGWTALLAGIMFILFPVAYAALLRWVVRAERPQGPFYIRFGGDELRLIAGWTVVFGVMLIMTVVVAALAGGLAYLAGYVSAASLSPLQLAGFGVGILVAVLIAALSIWVMLRLSLLSAASIATKSIGMLGSWRHSRGNSLGLLALWFLVGVLPFTIYYIAYVVLVPHYLMATIVSFGGGRDPVADLELFQAMEREVATMLPWLTLLTFAFNLAYVPLTALAGGFAYNALAGRSSDVANAFEEQA